MKVHSWVRASDVRVDIRRSHLSVAVSTTDGRHKTEHGANPQIAVADREDPRSPRQTADLLRDEQTILAGALSRPVQVDECLWTMERPGRVLLYLQKELSADGEPGFEWWATVMEGDEEVDVLTCDAGSDVSKYPEHARRRGAKALWEHQLKSPEERRKEELKEVCFWWWWWWWR